MRFSDPRQVVAASSRTVKVTTGPAPASGVSLRSAKAGKGAVTVGGSVRPAATSGGKVELLALNTAPGARARFRVLATQSLKAGKTTVALHAKVKPKTRWVVQPEYVRPGQPPSFSGVRTAATRQVRTVGRFALALVSALVAVSITSAGATADPNSNVLVPPTAYTSNGNTSDAVALATRRSGPDQARTRPGSA